MWDIKELKGRAKGRFKATYWKSVAVAAIYFVFVMGGSSVMSTKSEDIIESGNTGGSDAMAVILMLLGIFAVTLIIGFVIKIIVFNPIGAGIQRFFVKNQKAEADFGEVVYCFKNNLKNVVLGLFLKDLLITLGLFLFIVPGVVLAYCFRLVPYILTDEEMNCTGTQALKQSMEMMKGHMMNAFLLDLSFLGWDILSFITCGILQFFYVRPYKMNTDARLYLVIKGEQL